MALLIFSSAFMVCTVCPVWNTVFHEFTSNTFTDLILALMLKKVAVYIWGNDIRADIWDLQ